MKRVTVALAFAFLIVFFYGCNISASTDVPPMSTASQTTTSIPSHGSVISFGSVGMYAFDCFNGYLYELVGDDRGMVVKYQRSEVSATPIGLDYNPLRPEEDGTAVYAVSGASNAKGLNVPQSIAILSQTTQDFLRADYFLKDTITFNDKTYLIAPLAIVGLLDEEKFQPYKTKQKIGQCAEGYDVYSLESPKKAGVLAVDIPGMTIDVGLGMLYPAAIPQ